MPVAKPSSGLHLTNLDAPSSTTGLIGNTKQIDQLCQIQPPGRVQIVQKRSHLPSRSPQDELLQKAAVIDSLPQAIQEEPVILLGKEYKLVINEPKNTTAGNTAVNTIDLKIITCLLSRLRCK